MNDDCGFFLEYCSCFNVLFSGHVRNPVLFCLNLSITHDNLVDHAFINRKEIFVNDILFFLFNHSRILKLLLGILIFMAI